PARGQASPVADPADPPPSPRRMDDLDQPEDDPEDRKHGKAEDHPAGDQDDRAERASRHGQEAGRGGTATVPRTEASTPAEFAPRIDLSRSRTMRCSMTGPATALTWSGRTNAWPSRLAAAWD